MAQLGEPISCERRGLAKYFNNELGPEVGHLLRHEVDDTSLKQLRERHSMGELLNFMLRKINKSR